MIISFSTGTAWGTMTILTPVAIPLAYQFTGDPVISVCMAGIVFSGAIFGDHCSPISDTTVLASIFAGADHMDHVNTQVPYAVTVAAVAGIMYLLFGFLNIGPSLTIPLGLVLLSGLIWLLPKLAERKAG
jgi:Na+/H+ antiporter NhaC